MDAAILFSDILVIPHALGVPLLAGGAALDRGLDSILETFSERPFIFNLGHGILPQTPIAHVEQMLARVRRGAK